MKSSSYRILRRIALVAGLAGAGAAASAAPCPALLDRQMPRLQDERPQSLCQYSGQVVLVVNTASFCGFTPQYRSLEWLHARYRTRGLVVLGFPSNDFGAQEPGADKDIAEFCENTFGVRFPMFTKSHVIARGGAPVNPLFADLARLTGQTPGWNFHKYVIARDGRTVTSHASEVDPQDRAFIKVIEKLLDAKEN
jgi:glutathione peroxidase